MHRTLSACCAVLAFFIATSGSVAQERVDLPQPAGKTDYEHPGAPWCGTATLVNSPEGQAALQRFFEAKENGTLPRVSKTQERLEVGALQTFNIITDSAWVPAQFELKANGTRFNVWLRSDVPDQAPVSDTRIEELRQALEQATPDRSLDPGKGVFALDESVFGQAPVYPAGSDGVVDILVYELASGIAGFVSPTDVDPNAEAGQGNQGEVLHIWLDGFFRDDDVRIESVIAHEYQHLIHLNYDPREIQFVNEGLSEYAQLMVGYTAVVPAHLLIPEYNISFFSWRNGSDAVIYDYTRASTWHGYLGDQLGPELTGSITRNTQIGLEGYKAVLSDAGFPRTMDDLILDFYTALIVNDLSVDPRFGIIDPVRTSQIDIQLPKNRRFDGTKGTEANLDSLVIQPGGTEYVEWSNLTDFEFTFDVKAGPDFIEARRQHARLRIIAEPINGDREILDFAPSAESHLIEGTFKKVTLVAANVRPEVVPLPAFLHSSWSTSSELQIVSYAYGQDVPCCQSAGGVDPLAFTMAAGPDGAIAVRFPVPPGGQLTDVDLGIFHKNEWGSGSLTAPRDYLLTVWDNDNGFPGEIIYSEVYENPNPAQLVSIAAYRWQSFEFSPALGKDFALPDTIYVGAREAGADDNYMVVWVARTDPGAFENRRAIDTGYVGGADDQGTRIWVPSWDVTFTTSEEGARPLRSTALPVRARFLVDQAAVSVEETGELPASITLGQNYPNPFNPSTRIEFALPEARDVQLKVYDMTGREVATLIDGLRAAGTYRLTVNGSDWASGMYIYRLRAGDRQIVKRMILLK